MMDALQYQNTSCETWMDHVLVYSVNLLKERKKATDRPPSCQQAIVLITDSLYENYTDLMNVLDPDGSIRSVKFIKLAKQQ